MAKLKLVIHPLFFLYGLYFALCGKVFSFVCFVITALLHELGHYFISSYCGYKLKRIVLMPFGAIIDGGMTAFSYSDEIKIALAGPIINLITVLFFAALWWIFPNCYPYTELIVFTNLTVASINLLPCYPLDGGRILTATLSLYMKRQTAVIIGKIVGVILGLGLLGLFVYSCFTSFNLSLLFFAAFVLFGIRSNENNRYIRIYKSINPDVIKRGAEVKQFVVNEKTPVKELFRLLGANTVCELKLLSSDGKVKKKLNFDAVQRLLYEADIYQSIGEASRKVL